MRRYTREALWFIAGVALLAVLGVWGEVQIGGPRPSFLAFGVLTIGAALAHLYPIRSAREGAVYVLSNVFLFAGLLLMPPVLFAAMGVCALVPLTWAQRRRPGALIRFAFNASQSVLAMLAASGTMRLIGVLWTGPVAEVCLMLAGILVFTAVQTACVVVIIALNSRIPITRVDGVNLTSFLSDALMPFFGALVALVWQARPAMLFLFLPPLLAVYSVMRNVQLIRQADLDTKTGLYNYSYFVQNMNQTLQYARLVRRPTAVLFADMDLLREINNTYGHLAGDTAIRHVAAVLIKELPQNAVVARFGGEEFVALLPGTHPDEAEFIGWRICREVGRTALELGDGRQIKVTVSVGVAGYPDYGNTTEEIIHAADLAVYAAKARGRNRVVSARTLTLEEQQAGRDRREQSVPQAGSATAHATVVPRPLPPAVPQPTQTEAPSPSPAALADTRWLVGAISVAAVTVIGVTAPAVAQLSPMTLLLIVAAAIVGELLRLAIPGPSGSSHASLSLAVTVVMGAGTRYGVAGALVAGLAAGVTHLILKRQTALVKIAFNLASPILTSALTGLLLQWRAESVMPLAARVLVCISAAGVNCLASHLLVSLMISRERHCSIATVIRSMGRETVSHYVTLGSLGAFMILSYPALGWAGPSMFILPAVLLYATFGQRLRQSGERIAGLEQIRSQLEVAQRQQKASLDEMVVTLAGVIDARDASVLGHSANVARYAQALALELGMSEAQADKVRLGGLLHDIGKIGVPEAILSKAGRLTAEEWVIMRSHAALGERLLSQVGQLDEVARMVGEHHERWSGKGYPAGKAGSQISLGGRILTVADALDCMLTDRPYSQAHPVGWAIAELERCAGEQFDPQVVGAVKALLAREGEAFFAMGGDAGRSAYCPVAQTVR